MSVEDFPVDRIKRIPVNLPFDPAALPSCEHGSAPCDKCAAQDRLALRIIAGFGADEPQPERQPLIDAIKLLESCGCTIYPRR